MSSKRYNDRKTIDDSSEILQNTLNNKNLKFIKHYNTANFKYPTEYEYSELNIAIETWKVGDKLYKYSYKYYGDTELWWIIAWFNQKPTEGHFSIGDKVMIPLPIEKLYKYFGI